MKLTVDGKSYVQPLTVKMDPRVKTPAAALEQQFELSMQCYLDIRQVAKAIDQVGEMAQNAATRQRRQSTPG